MNCCTCELPFTVTVCFRLFHCILYACAYYVRSFTVLVHIWLAIPVLTVTSVEQLCWLDQSHYYWSNLCPVFHLCDTETNSLVNLAFCPVWDSKIGWIILYGDDGRLSYVFRLCNTETKSFAILAFCPVGMLNWMNNPIWRCCVYETAVIKHLLKLFSKNIRSVHNYPHKFDGIGMLQTSEVILYLCNFCIDCVDSTDGVYVHASPVFI